MPVRHKFCRPFFPHFPDLLTLYYRPQTKLREGIFYTCLSVHRGWGGGSAIPPWDQTLPLSGIRHPRLPLGPDPPPPRDLEVTSYPHKEHGSRQESPRPPPSTKVGSTHPIGMLSCVLIWSLLLPCLIALIILFGPVISESSLNKYLGPASTKVVFCYLNSSDH